MTQVSVDVGTQAYQIACQTKFVSHSTSKLSTALQKTEEEFHIQCALFLLSENTYTLEEKIEGLQQALKANKNGGIGTALDFIADATEKTMHIHENCIVSERKKQWLQHALGGILDQQDDIDQRRARLKTEEEQYLVLQKDIFQVGTHVHNRMIPKHPGGADEFFIYNYDVIAKRFDDAFLKRFDGFQMADYEDSQKEQEFVQHCKDVFWEAIQGPKKYEVDAADKQYGDEQLDIAIEKYLNRNRSMHVDKINIEDVIKQRQSDRDQSKNNFKYRRSN